LQFELSVPPATVSSVGALWREVASGEIGAPERARSSAISSARRDSRTRKFDGLVKLFRDTALYIPQLNRVIFVNNSLILAKGLVSRLSRRRRWDFRPRAGNLPLARACARLIGGKLTKRLGGQLPDRELAVTLNRMRCKFVDGKAWTTVRVRELRERLGIDAFDPALPRAETISAGATADTARDLHRLGP
jgi:hypothetical protein